MILREIRKEGVSKSHFRHGLFQGQKYHLPDFSKYTKQTSVLEEHLSLVPFSILLPFALEKFFCICTYKYDGKFFSYEYELKF